MSNKNEFLAKQDTLSAIPDSAINTVKRMPIAIYIHEAEALAKWCRDDRAAFKTIGGLWKLVTDIPIRAGALRELESMWRNERNTPDAASLRWKEESPALWEMRKTLYKPSVTPSGRTKFFCDGLALSQKEIPMRSDCKA